MLPNTQFAYCNGLGTRDAVLRVSRKRQNALQSGEDIRIGQINFSAAFDKAMSIVVSVWPILTQFLSNRKLHVIVEVCRCKMVNVMSGVQQGSLLCPLFFLLYTSELFSILENKLIGYADATVPDV